MSRKRRSCTTEYKVEAARRVIDSGRTIAEVARELGINKALLGRWVADERRRIEATAASGDQPLTTAERTELARLRRQVSEQEKDVAFLKKASLQSKGQCNSVFEGRCMLNDPNRACCNDDQCCARRWSRCSKTSGRRSRSSDTSDATTAATTSWRSATRRSTARSIPRGGVSFLKNCANAYEHHSMGRYPVRRRRQRYTGLDRVAWCETIRLVRRGHGP